MRHAARHLLAVLWSATAWMAGAGLAAAQEPGRPPAAPHAYVVPEQQPAKLLAYNLALGAGIGGVGAALTGKTGTAWERFWRGAGRGALGGALLYEGKRLTHLIVQHEQPAYGLLAVGVHELGGSIVENASYDRPVFERLTLHTGFVRWEWRPGAGAQVRVMPYALNASLYLLRVDYRLDVPKSLALATPVFIGGTQEQIAAGDGFARYGFAGREAIALADPALLPPMRDPDIVRRVLAHELVHILQHREFYRANVVAQPLLSQARRIRLVDTWYARAGQYVYLDAPYLQQEVYELLRHEPRCHYNNWFEREAQGFALNSPIPICR